MSNQIEQYQNTATDVAKPQTLMQKGVEKLRQHAELKAMATEYADFITQTGSCPDIFKKKPMDAAAAIIRGTALGFDPDGALEAFFVIHGKTGMYARAMIAVAENVGCTVWEEEASDGRVVWCGTKPGSAKVERSEWTIQRAETAGYTSNKKYQTNPQEMLRAKCQTELSRILAPGALMGLVSEAEPDAHEPVKMTATRREPVKAKGMDALESAAMDDDEPSQDDTAGYVAEVTEHLATLDTQEQVNEFMASLQAQDANLPEGVLAAGRARWEEIND